MKTQQEIEEMAKELLKHLAPNSYIDHGLSEFTLKDAIESILFIKKDILASASGGFEEAWKNYRYSFNYGHKEALIFGWQACAISYEKKIQEKDERIKKLEYELHEKNTIGANSNYAHKEIILEKDAEIERLRHELRSKYGEDGFFGMKDKYQEAVKDIELLLRDVCPDREFNCNQLKEIRKRHGISEE